MKNSDYWKLRFGQLEAAQNKLASNSRAEIERLYRETTKELEGKINTWYVRLGTNNDVSMAEARKKLSASELRKFKWNVRDYIKYAEENALSGQWVKQLKSFSDRLSVSKYDALMIQTRQSIESLFAKQSGITSSTMKEVYQSGFYHTAFEVQKGFGIGWDISGIEQNQLDKIIAKPWAVDGKNFSERILGNKQRLIAEVHNELTQNIITGDDPQKAINAIASKLNALKSNAGRLVMTEEAYFNSLAQKDCFDELGVEEYEITATLDAHTSEICQSMDGKRFPMKDFQAGVTAPPFHPWCRSIVCPCFDDDFGEHGKRYCIPESMSYEEWKERFVDGGGKEGLTAVDKSGNGGIIKKKENLNDYIGKPIVKTDNQHIREWYYANVSDIPNQIDKTKPFELQVKQAFELRNKYKHEARIAMSDEATAQMLEQKRPVLTFDELLKNKMKRKSMTEQEALEDILKTASKTNADVNKEFGL